MAEIGPGFLTTPMREAAELVAAELRRLPWSPAIQSPGAHLSLSLLS